MDTAIVTTRLIGQDAISNFTMASAEALKKLGQVYIYTFAYERPMVDGVDVRFLGGKNAHSLGTNVRALLGTFGLARELSRYDVLIIINPDVGSVLAYHLARRYNPGLKIMWTFHGLTPVELVSGLRDRWLMRARERAYIWSMKRSELVQVFSNYIKSDVIQRGVAPSKAVVMPLGVDLGRMAAGDGRRIREEHGIGDRFLLLYVGRLSNFKHVDELIRAVSGVDAGLMVVGGGPERERLESLARELHARVAFAGIVPDGELADYYTACDAWATGSRHEGFCVPIVEAMAAGKPVVVPEAAAMPETAGDAGLTYASGDVADLSRKIGVLMADKGLYARLSGRARARAAAFKIDVIMDGYRDMVARLYKED